MEFIKPKRSVNKVYIHCSDSNSPSHDNIATITKWHTDPKPPKGEKMRAGYGRGWKYVGYHFFIRQDGTIEKGRSLEKSPSAQGLYKGKYYNKGSITICLSGGRHNKLDSFTQKQFNSLGTFCQKINDSYNKKVSFHGHCEVSKKKCPVFDYRKILNLDNNGYIIYYSSRESTTAKLSKLNVKKKMPLPLLAGLMLPMITKLGIKGFDKLKDKAKDTVFKLILNKTGINLSDNPTPQDVEDAVNKLPPEEQLKLKTAIINSESELKIAELENETKQTSIVNETMRMEMQSDDIFLKRARPTNIYCFAFCMTVFFVGFVSLSIYEVIIQNVEMVEMITKLIFAFLGIAGFWATIVGVNINSRGKEKIERIKRFAN